MPYVTEGTQPGPKGWKGGRTERNHVQEADRHLTACWVPSLPCLQPKEDTINNAMSNTGLSFPQTVRSRTRSRRGQRTKEGYLDTGSHDMHLREQRCSALFKHLKDYYLNVYCVQLQKENCVCQVEISREESKIFYSDEGGSSLCYESRAM